MPYRLIWAASLATFMFGALAFSTLWLLYWRQRRREGSGGSAVFALFSLVCAAAFLLNLAQQADRRLSWLGPALDLAAGMTPALLMHLVSREEGSGPRWLTAGFYAVCGAGALLVAAADGGVAPASWGDALESVPAAVLGAAGVLGLGLQAASRRALDSAGRRHRWWMRVLLALLAASAAGSMVQASPVFNLLPDYLLLAVFCVTLYYKERLVFFDLLLKRGVFLGIGFLASAAVVVFGPANPMAQALLLAPLWLAAPWLYARLSAAIDHAWLRRRYTAPEAERRFAQAMQEAENEQELQTGAVRALGEIFGAKATVVFGAGKAPIGELAAEAGPHGWIALGARASCIPYLSGDRELLQSLARTLGVVVENVRFREQEQQLRLLAGRAQLKALRAQINPHFLFNALNAIASLIHTNAGAAEETVEQLAEVFRYTLRKSEKEWVRLEEELEFVGAYLRVEKARFGDRLAVEIAADPAAAAIPVPAMCIQPLVENAIKHGTSVIEGCGRLTLHASLEGDTLVVEVGDNGPGFPESFRLSRDAAGHGLRNVAERLAGYYGSAAGLKCCNRKGGAYVVVRIPRQGLRRDASADRR
jgi:signal transduction histidine kinase